MKLDLPTENLVYRLHKNEGVWRTDLRTQLARTSLGALWGITQDAPDLVLVASVIYRLEALIKLRNSREQIVLRALYNITPDHELRKLKLTERRGTIARQYQDEAFSVASQGRILKPFQESILASLRSRLPEIDERMLLDIVRREARFNDEAAKFVGPATFTTLVRKSYETPSTEPTDAFLRVRVTLALSQSGQPIIARTYTEGAWLCVFTTEQGLTAHQQATRNRQVQSGKSRTLSGAEIVRLVSNLGNHVGILVDPPASPDANATGTLDISPERVAELTRQP